MNMRLVLFANNRAGLEVTRWLAARADAEIVALVVHPAGKAKHASEMIEATGLGPDAVFDGARLGDPSVIDALAKTRAEMGVSLLFDYILKADLLRLFPRGVVNLHPGYLPFNRGQYPNVWSIVERTPAGATMHYIDEGIDTGNIIAQRKVDVDPADTGESLYRRLEAECVTLFTDTWPALVSGAVRPTPQRPGGTYHRTTDVARIDEIELERSYTGRELIDILRARSFPPYRGAFFRAGGRKIYITVQLDAEEDQEGA